VPRVFLTPVAILRALAAGAPKLHDVLAEAMTVSREDPEIEIVRDAASTISPPTWTVVVRAGRYVRDLPLDTGADEAMSAAFMLLLTELVHDLQKELPHIFERAEIARGVDRLVPWPRSKKAEPS
jgi:hypothetical protein